jgi:hypothetical protein
MRAQRIWIEIVLLGTAIALLLALFLATIGVAAGIAESGSQPEQSATRPDTLPPAPERTFEGMVTCSSCGAKHSPALQRPATVCVRVCVHGGASFALVNADSSYLLEGDSEVLKRVAGVRARIRGNLSGKTIKVKSVTAAT